MKKRKKSPSAALRALSDPLFKPRVVPAKKGRGSYQRKRKDAQLEEKVTRFYKKLYRSQESLGTEFHLILNDNYWDLLEK